MLRKPSFIINISIWQLFKSESNMEMSNVMIAGDVTIESEEDAYRYQIKIEESFQKQLGFRLKTGDIIMTHFDTIITNNGKKQKMPRRKSKIFER